MELSSFTVALKVASLSSVMPLRLQTETARRAINRSLFMFDLFKKYEEFKISDYISGIFFKLYREYYPLFNIYTPKGYYFSRMRYKNKPALIL